MRDGWTEATLGEIATVSIGRTPPRKDPRYWTNDLERPFCTIADLEWLTNPTREGVTQLAEAEGKAKRFPKGSLMMSFKLTIGRVGFAARDLFPNEAIARLVPREGVDAAFLALALQAQDLEEYAGRAVKGRTLTREAIHAIPILVPPPEEQRRIVDLIASIDGAERLADDWRNRARQAGTALRAAHFASTEGRVKITELADLTMGRQRAPKYAQGDYVIPYLRAANVKDGELLLGGILEMNFDPREQLRFALEPGDTLVTEGCGSIDEIGASSQWQGEVPGVVAFQNTLLRLRAKEGSADPSYIYQWARYCYESGEFARVASGTNIFHIGAARAAEMTIRSVPVDRQREIARLMADVDSVERESRRVARHLSKTRARLLHDLLSGNHEIPESYDHFLEAAS